MHTDPSGERSSEPLEAQIAAVQALLETWQDVCARYARDERSQHGVLGLFVVLHLAHYVQPAGPEAGPYRMSEADEAWVREWLAVIPRWVRNYLLDGPSIPGAQP